ncbi:hypothetical protein EVAR_102100_1 [Eumeta japonica]|uniref:Uncharacterized protein n=1 Tax=Eumeta variegata TaxID=151549 RepID=A0A4C1TZR0_EUMVA|nr:hypothetical protein EVAR_102100_1 [Eumeta japonica]
MPTRPILRKLQTDYCLQFPGVLKTTDSSSLRESLSCNGQRATKASLPAATDHHSLHPGGCDCLQFPEDVPGWYETCHNYKTSGADAESRPTAEPRRTDHNYVYEEPFNHYPKRRGSWTFLVLFSNSGSRSYNN